MTEPIRPREFNAATALVPVGRTAPDTYVAFGPDWPEDLPPLVAWDGLDLNSPTTQMALAQAVGLASIVANLDQARRSALGLVQLDAATLAKMGAGAQPMTNEVGNLGVLIDPQSGHIASHIVWHPAGGAAGPAAFIASLGNSLTLVAIQAQLAGMDRKLDDLLDISNAILREARLDQWTSTRAAVVQVRMLLHETQESSDVPDDVMAEGRALSLELLRGELLMQERLKVLAADLASPSSASDRRRWLARNSGALLSDAQTLILAAQGRLLYQGIRASYVSQSDPGRGATIYRNAVRHYQRVTAEAANAMVQAERTLRLIALDPGSQGLTILGRRRTRKQVKRAARSTARLLRQQGLTLERPLVSPDIEQIGKHRVGSKRIRRLSWHLAPGETLHAVGEFENRIVAVTSHRILVVDDEDVEDVDWILDPAEVRRVSVERHRRIPRGAARWRAKYGLRGGGRRTLAIAGHSRMGKKKAKRLARRPLQLGMSVREPNDRTVEARPEAAAIEG